MNERPRLLDQWLLVKQASVDARLSRGDVAVLIAVLDRLNDAGVAWPSLARISADASVSRPTAVRSVKKLTDFDYLRRESGSRVNSNRYRSGRCAVEPRCTDEPRFTDEPGVGANRCVEVGAPVNPELASRNPPKEPTQESARTRKSAQVDLPAWLPADAWRDWVDHRKAVGRKFTPKAQAIALRKLEELRAAGHDPRKLIELAIESGWSSFNPRESTRAGGQRGHRVGAIPRDDRPDDEINAANREQLARFGIEVTP